MIEIRPRYSRSWADSRYSPILASEVSERLIERCRGEQVVKIELTYARDGYADPQELFDAASEERHIRRFIAKLSEHLGGSLSGRWLCKMEFQRGGWVHWHLIILGVTWVDQGELTRLWGHGYVWVRKAKERDLRYTCKYFSKDGAIPAFIYARPIRSVKFIRTSPGFWKRPADGNESESVTCDEGQTVEDAAIQEPPKSPRLPIYRSIGQMIEDGEQITVCRDMEDHFAQCKLGFSKVLERLLARGGEVLGGAKGWITVAGVTINDVLLIVSARAGWPRKRPPAGLHLIYSGNPPAVPKWLDWYIGWQLSWRDNGEG